MKVKKDPNRYPKGWNAKSIQKLIDHYEKQTEDEAVAEDEASFEDRTQTVMEVPKALVPAIRELIAKRRARPGRTSRSRRRPKAGRA